MIKNISLSLGMRASCRGRCIIENNCVSINIGPPINDKVLCQLSDSDHIRHPDDLKPRDGFMYRSTEVRADSKSIYAILIFTRSRVLFSKGICQWCVPCLFLCFFFCLFVTFFVSVFHITLQTIHKLNAKPEEDAKLSTLIKN